MSTLHVLLIEDNPGDVRLVREAFEESPIDSSLTLCTDGEDALDCLFQRAEYESAARPDLVILDLNIPKVSGRQVLGRVDAAPDLSSPPVLVLSGSKSRDDVLETYELGAAGYVTKPTNPNEFISTIQTIAASFANSESIPAGEYSDLDRDE